MPVPTVITDLDPIAGNNSPASSESPKDGDDYIRALSAFIAQCYLGDATNATNLTGTNQSTAHTWAETQSFSKAINVSVGSSATSLVVNGRSSDDYSNLVFRDRSGTVYTGSVGISADGTFTFSRGSALSTSFVFGPSGQLGIGGATYGTSGQALISGGSGAAPSWGNVNSVGVGQTWQDMSGSRSFGQNYQNQTGKPIQIKVGCTGSASLSTDGGVTDGFNGNTPAFHGTVSAIIPPDGNYSVSCGFTMDFWMELR